MSDLQAASSATTVAEGEIPLLAGEGVSYWQKIRKAFFSRVAQRIAVGYIILLALVAVFVPFIANGRPYTAVVDGKRVWPLFRALTTVDISVLIAGLCVISYFVVVFFTRKRPAREDRALPRRWTILIAGILGVLSISGVLLLKDDYNDLLRREDYKKISGEYEVTSAIFPPVSWGFDDAIYPRKPGTEFLPPSDHPILGTDKSGRDEFSRLLWSARIVFGIGLISQLIAISIGVVYGALMGYFGGIVDILGSRFIELVESVPTLFIIITIVAIFGRQIFLIMIIIGLTSWSGYARFLRAEFFKIRKMDYVSAAVAGGLPLWSILFRHMLPNGLTPVLVNATFGIAGAVTIESSLSFLDLGVEPPMSSWGSMLYEAGNPGEIFHPWQATMPGVMIFLTIFAFNVIGEGFQESINPRLNRSE